MITKATIMEAYLFMRKENQSVPSETLEFMKDTALAELQKCKVKNLGLFSVSNNEVAVCPECDNPYFHKTQLGDCWCEDCGNEWQTDC